MSPRIRLALIGAGNVMTTRHLPALRHNAHLFELRGIVDSNAERAKAVAQAHGIRNDGAVSGASELSAFEWLADVDAAIIAVPPQKHHAMVKACLSLGKHVLVEKPFTVTVDDAQDLVRLAKAQKRILAVKHNFQFARSFLRLGRLLEAGALGHVQSIYCAQLTNQARRIPAWAEELPVGLFYDESPHYFYLIRKFTGHDIVVRNAYQSRSPTRAATPRELTLNLDAGDVPVTVYWNFDSPVCEWYFAVLGETRLAVVDLFRDILVVLPNDAPHLGYQVMRTSVLSTLQHWKGVAVNGLSYLRSSLYYGFDIAQQNFHAAVASGDASHIRGMSGEDGLFVTEIQNRIVTRLASGAGPTADG